MAWFRLSGGRLEYRGRITPEGYTEWTDTEGRALIDTLTASRRFSLLGRHRAVVRDIWKDLQQAARSQDLASAIQQEADRYLHLLGSMAAALTSLPRSSGPRPVAAVPRHLLNARVYEGIARQLGSAPALQSLAGGSSLRDFFLLRLVEELDAALIASQPSPRQPVPADGEWVVVGHDDALVWRRPFQGKTWSGHLYLYEARQGKIRRRDRAEVAKLLAEVQRLIGGLSYEARDQILMRAR